LNITIAPAEISAGLPSAAMTCRMSPQNYAVRDVLHHIDHHTCEQSTQNDPDQLGMCHHILV
jgi:hypothetical protein